MNTTSETKTTQVGHVSWNELIASDTRASSDFYTKLFGWQATPFKGEGMPANMPPYMLFKADSEDMGAGGMMQAMMPGTPTHWVPYVVVEDADASVAKAAKLGAKVLFPVTKMGDIGRIALLQDPQGASVGLHELPE
jgi:uncharacterized protein